jgi:hypothetical protein
MKDWRRGCTSKVGAARHSQLGIRFHPEGTSLNGHPPQPSRRKRGEKGEETLPNLLTTALRSPWPIGF